MLAIISSTFKEALRKKFFIVMGILSLIYLVFFAIILYFFKREITDNIYMNSQTILNVASQLVSVVGFYFSSMQIALLSIVISSGSIASEIESGLLHSIITRPIRRFEYILGKAAGLAIVTCGYALIMYFMVLLMCTLFGLPFVANLDFVTIISGLFFWILQPFCILCLTTCGSVLFKTIPNAILVIFVYVLGNIGGMIEQVGKLINNQNLISGGIFLSLVSPFNVIYNKMIDTVFYTSGISNMMFSMSGMSGSVPSRAMWVYIACYMVFFLSMAVFRFSRKDLA